jgi:DNA modification methylase
MEYKNENLWLMKGDCLERMKEIESGSVDMILTDPPYGIDFQSQWKKDKTKWMPKIANDKKPFIEFIEEASRCLSITGCMIVFCRFDSWQAFADECDRYGLKVKSQIVWNKVVHGMGDLRGATALQHELALFITKGKFRFPGKRQKSIVTHTRVNPKDMLHPNEKPVSLMNELIEGYTREGQLILDCFTGVSPVGVAAKNLNRKFIGIEMDGKYFDIAKDRIINS